MTIVRDMVSELLESMPVHTLSSSLLRLTSSEKFQYIYHANARRFSQPAERYPSELDLDCGAACRNKNIRPKRRTHVTITGSASSFLVFFLASMVSSPVKAPLGALLLLLFTFTTLVIAPCPEVALNARLWTDVLGTPLGIIAAMLFITP